MVTIDEIQTKWGQIKRRCRTIPYGAIVAALLNGCELRELVRTNCTADILSIIPRQTFHYRNLSTPAYVALIERAISYEINEYISVQIIDPREESRPCSQISPRVVREVGEILEVLHF